MQPAYSTARGVHCDGTHVPRNASITVEQAGENWIKRAEADGRERGTVTQYRQHLALHINPRLGLVKLADLSTPQIANFDRDLHKANISEAMRRKVLVSLRSLLRLAMTEGHVNRNAAEPVRLKINKRAEGKLVVGGHPKPGGDSELSARSRWEPVAPASSDGGFHRHAGERAAWPALGQRRVRGR